MMTLTAGLILGLFLLAACMPAGNTVIYGKTPDEPSPGEAKASVTPEPEVTIPPDGSQYGFESGEVPQELFDTVLADLMNRTGAPGTDVVVTKSEEVVWNDGSLGCPQPDMMYTQALVDGYQVVFEVNGASFDYHLSAQGDFVLCESALPQ